MFPMTITLSTPAQLNAVLTALNLGFEPPAPRDAVSAPRPIPEPTEKEAAPATTALPAQLTATAIQPTPEPGHSTATDEAPTYQDTATAISKLARVKSREAALTVLAKFGATKLPEISPEQFAAVLAAANEAMGG